MPLSIIICKTERWHALKSEGCEVRKKKKKIEEEDGGALKDCFAKDLSFVLFLLVFFFFFLLYWICDCLKVFLII